MWQVQLVMFRHLRVCSEVACLKILTPQKSDCLGICKHSKWRQDVEQNEQEEMRRWSQLASIRALERFVCNENVNELAKAK